jgi:hypothetical protein
MTSLVLGNPSISRSSVLPIGSSSPARWISAETEKTYRRLKDTYSVGLLRKDACPSVYDELENVVAECTNQGWDGDEAQPISEEAINNARLFLDALPLRITPPSVGAEPDGYLTLEWYSSPRHLLSISIGAENQIYYACKLGERKSHGSELFFGNIPKILIDLLNRVEQSW